MTRRFGRRLALFSAAVTLGWMVASGPVVGQHLAAGPAHAGGAGEETAVFAGGCFWVQANLRYPASIATAVSDAQIVINLVGIMNQSGAQNFDAVQAKGAATVAQATAAAGARLIHVSAIGAERLQEARPL